MFNKGFVKKVVVVTLGLTLSVTSIVAQDVKTKVNQPVETYEVKRIESYNELVELIKKQNEEQDKLLEVVPELEVGMSEDMMTETQEASNKLEVSTTNVQVEGVDEADQVKFTDTHILSLSNQSVQIISKDPKNLKVVATLTPQHQETYYEMMYVDKNKLIILGKVYEPENKKQVEDGVNLSQSVMKWEPYYQPMSRTLVEVYDLTNPVKPVLKRSIKLDGDLLTSRYVNGKLYVISNQFINRWRITDTKQQELLPGYYDSLTQREEKVSINNLCYPIDERLSSFTILSEVGVEANTPVQMRSFLGDTQEVYMSKDNVYLAQYSYRYDYERGYTSIVKYDLETLTYRKGVKVPGNMLNQFAMDEYKGHLRVATTTTQGNHLFILDESFSLASQLRNLAPGEDIYAARFMGDMAYLVTFEQIDPLFAIDVSQPKSPKVLGELKIPGYSNYLHPVGEGRLIGVGHDTIQIVERYSDGTEVVSGIRQGGVKISLFDVANPKKPKEVAMAIYPIKDSSSEVTFNHKAFYFDKTNKVIGVPIQAYDNQGIVSGIWFMSLKNQGLTDLGTTEIPEAYGSLGSRVGYIDKYIYIVQVGERGTQVIVLDRLNHKKIQEAFF